MLSFRPRARVFHRRALTAVAVTGLLGMALGIGPVLLESGPAYASTPCGNYGTFTFTSFTLTCTYWRPGADTFTVPAGVTEVAVDGNGAQGGAGYSCDEAGPLSQGGWGASAAAEFAVQAGETLQVDAGAEGGVPSGTGPGGGGGFGGGGHGGSGGPEGIALGSEFCGSSGGGGGGGASDVRAGSCAATLSCGLSAAIIVAGGGGGGGGGGPGGGGPGAYPTAGGPGGAGGGVQGGNGANGTGPSGNGSGGQGSAGPPGGLAGGGGTGRGGGGNGAAGTPGSAGSGGAGGSGGSPGFLGAGGDGGGGGGGGYFAGGGAGGGGGVSFTIGDEGTGGGGGGGSSWIAPSAAAGTTEIEPGAQQGNGYVTVTWTAQPLTLVTQATQDGLPETPVAVGQGIDDVATLSGGVNPTGTIVFSLYGPGDTSCATPVATSAATVNGDGTYTSALYTTTLAGTYYWVASYSGDSFNSPATEACGVPSETVTVAKAAPTLVTQASAGSPTPDSPINDSGTLGEGYDPTGSISFALYANDSCAGSPVVSSGSVPVNGNGTYNSGPVAAPAEPGTYYWVAAYSGDQNNDSVVTPCGAEPITVYSPGA